jgi:hypothetical protein
MRRFHESEAAMLALTWLGWAGAAAAGLGALVVAFYAIGLSFRNRVRREVIEHLRRAAPEITVVAEHQDRLELTWADAPAEGRATFFLGRLYDQASTLAAGNGPESRAARTAIYDTVVASIREGATGLEALDAAAERGNVMPRLLTDDALAAMRAQVGPAGQELPALPSGVAGLSIVFVLDRAATVAYLTRALLDDLQLTPETALDLARANLARTFSRDVVRSAVGSPDINVIKSLDSFDAARLLLVPGYLEPGESVVALIPDRDTLVLTMPPGDGDWSGLRTLARAADGDPLCAEPLVVTAEGIAAAA